MPITETSLNSMRTVASRIQQRLAAFAQRIVLLWDNAVIKNPDGTLSLIITDEQKSELKTELGAIADELEVIVTKIRQAIA